MRAIQHYLPNPRHAEMMRIFVKTKPEVTWQQVRHFDMSVVPWVRFLFSLRTITDLFHDERRIKEEGIGIDQITENATGFMILDELPGKEVVVGAVGKFWHLTIPFAEVKPGAFNDFNEPGWGKVAWCIIVESYLDGSTVCVDLRTTATDNESWKKLHRYYHVIGIFSRLIRHSLLTQFENELGKLDIPDDHTRILAGDEIIPDTQYSITDHINIEAPVSIVWRYLMQLGCDRAGWYSIDLLDHGGIPSTDHLVKEWSDDRKVGDRLSATPKRDSYFEVYDIAQEQYFVIGGEIEKPESSFKSSWAFVLEPIGEDATHLIVRARMKQSPEWKEWLMGKIVYPPVHGLMSAVQLKTIKRYAERDAQMRVTDKVSKELITVNHGA